MMVPLASRILYNGNQTKYLDLNLQIGSGLSNSMIKTLVLELFIV